MLAEAGVKDIFLAYNLVGPNIGRVVQFVAEVSRREVRRDGRPPGPIAALGEALAVGRQDD